jgi:hypothetical protein
MDKTKQCMQKANIKANLGMEQFLHCAYAVLFQAREQLADGFMNNLGCQLMLMQRQNGAQFLAVEIWPANGKWAASRVRESAAAYVKNLHAELMEKHGACAIPNRWAVVWHLDNQGLGVRDFDGDEAKGPMMAEAPSGTLDILGIFEHPQIELGWIEKAG